MLRAPVKSESAATEERNRGLFDPRWNTTFECAQPSRHSHSHSHSRCVLRVRIQCRQKWLWMFLRSCCPKCRAGGTPRSSIPRRTHPTVVTDNTHWTRRASELFYPPTSPAVHYSALFVAVWSSVLGATAAAGATHVPLPQVGYIIKKGSDYLTTHCPGWTWCR
jgi:hypothetical protein